MNLPLIEALDLRPPAKPADEMTWDFPKFPSRIEYFIKYGRFPRRIVFWATEGIVSLSDEWLAGWANAGWSVHVNVSPATMLFNPPKRRIPWWWIAYFAFVLTILAVDLWMAKWL